MRVADTIFALIMHGLDERREAMNPNKAKRSRNVSSKDLLQAAIVVAVLLVLGWYKEAGSRVAAILFAAIPLLGLCYYLLRIPPDERRKAEQWGHSELFQSWIGKLFFGFLLFLIIILAVLAAHRRISG